MPLQERPRLNLVLEPVLVPQGSVVSNGGERLPRTESEIRRERIWRNLAALYPDKKTAEIAEIHREIYLLIHTRREQYENQQYPKKTVGFTKADSYVITYPDTTFRVGNNKFGYDGATMDAFHDLFTGKDLNDDVVRLNTVINGVQLLPHQKASHLDRGFSQKDPYEVDPKFGSWENVRRLARMGVNVTVDQLVNHMSMEGEWFQRGEIGVETDGRRVVDPEYQDLFESYPAHERPWEMFIDNFKPREHSNWTLIDTARGPRWFRTTFGDKGTTDQVDLNYHNHKVLLKELDISLFDVVNGAGGIRMDSMAFTWKEPGEGNRGIHEPQVKHLLQIFRDVVDEVNPAVRLLSENNVPQAQNVEYLGKEGMPLASIIYDFGEAALGPHGIYTEQAGDITDWMLQQPTLPKGTSKINHVSCHDGIFLQEAYAYFKAKDIARGIPEDIAGKADMEILFKGIVDRGGQLAMRKSPRGEVAVYELDATLRSAVSEIRDPQETEDSGAVKPGIFS